MDHILKVYESSPIRPFKKKAMAVAENWVLEHQEPTGDWGGIQPAMLNSVLALHCLGYANDHPAVERGLEALANFCIEDDQSIVLQSCVSPLWDTALALKALLDADVPPDHPALVNATQWLLDREVRKPGDWKIKSPDLEPGGWAFEFLNDWYPDVDDSGIVMMAIKDVKVKNVRAKEDAIKRGIAWCLGMQSKDGGWGAFDKDNTKHILNKIPFADLEALIDPPTADLTGRMLELMGNFGYPKNHPAAVRGLAYHQGNTRNRTAPGGAAGGSTTSMAAGRSSPAWPPSAKTSRNRTSARRSTGSSPGRTSTAAGENPANPTMTRHWPGSAKAPRPRPAGPFWRSWPPERCTRRRSPRGSSTSSPPRNRTAPGMKNSLPAPASPSIS